MHTYECLPPFVSSSSGGIHSFVRWRNDRRDALFVREKRGTMGTDHRFHDSSTIGESWAGVRLSQLIPLRLRCMPYAGTATAEYVANTFSALLCVPQKSSLNNLGLARIRGSPASAWVSPSLATVLPLEYDRSSVFCCYFAAHITL